MSASFYASPTIGATTTVAVFFHEIPHEVGDFALLVQSGFSKRAAMGSQFITAIGAFLGTLIGIAVQEYGGAGAMEAGESMPRNAGLWGTSLVSHSCYTLCGFLLSGYTLCFSAFRLTDYDIIDLGRYASSVHGRYFPICWNCGSDS